MATPTDPVLRFDGTRLRAERARVGLSRRHVAIGTSLTTSAIKAMEHNRMRPSPYAYERLLNVLGLTSEAGAQRLLVLGPADHRPDERAGADAPPGDRWSRRRLAVLSMRRHRGGDTSRQRGRGDVL